MEHLRVPEYCPILADNPFSFAVVHLYLPIGVSVAHTLLM